MKNEVDRALVAKKKQFQSKSVPRGTRTIWRYLGALFILFTFAIGNVFGVDYNLINGNDNASTATLNKADFWTVQELQAKSNGGDLKKCLIMAGTISKGITNVKDPSKYIQYDMKTTATSFVIKVYNTNSSDLKINIYDVVEAANGTITATVAEKTATKGKLTTINYTPTTSHPVGTKSTFYVAVPSSQSKIEFYQITASETGTALTGTKGGRAGYSVNFNQKSRLAACSGKESRLDSMFYTVGSDYIPTNKTEIQPKSGNYVHFKTVEPVRLTVVNTNTYEFCVAKTQDGTTHSTTTAGTHTYDLTEVGEWYIIAKNSNASKITEIAFDALYTVTYAAGEGSGSMDADYGCAAEEMTLADNEFEAPDGFEFDKWVVTKTASGNPITVTAGKFTMPAEAVTVTATWKPLGVKYDITYNKGAYGTGEIAAGKKSKGEAFTLSSERFTRAGYVQTGWSLTDGGTKAYDLGGSYTTDAEQEFFPVWAETSTYVASFACGATAPAGWTFSNAGTYGAEDATADYVCKFVTAGTSTPKTTTGDGTEDDNVAFAKSSNAIATFDLGAATTITALNVTLCGGSSSAFDETIEYLGADGITVKKSYTNSLGAGNWKDNAVNKSDVVDGVRYIRVHGAARWVVMKAFSVTYVDLVTKYNVTFDKNGGSGDDMATLKYVEGAEVTLPACSFTAPTNKEFDAWTSTDVTISNNKFTMPNKAVTIKATWKAIVAKYTVIFKDGDVTLGTKQFDVASNPSDADIDKTKPLYTFAAWQKDNADITLDAAFWATVAKDAEVTLTARWAKAYAQSIDMEQFVLDNGKAGNWHAYLDSKGYAYSDSDLSLDSLDNGSGKVKNNYQFLGLKFAKNSTDKYVKGNLPAGKLMIVKVGQVGNVKMKIDGVAQDEPAIESGVAADSAAAYTYWYSATDKVYCFYKIDGATTVLKAITIRDPYEVSFDPHGADPIAVRYGTPKVTLPTPENGTGVFKGWYDAETAGNKIGNAGAEYQPTANITLHAQWETLSSDNTLASWKIDGVAKDVPVSRILYIEEPYGVTPVISEPVATANVGLETPIAEVLYSNTPVHYQSATEDFWYVQAEVHPQDPNAAIGYYQVRYTNAPKLGATIFKAELTAANDADYSGLYVDADNSQIALVVDPDNNNEYKFSGKSNYIKMALADATFAESDVLKMTYTTNPQQGELAIYDGTTKLQGTPYSNNTLTFSDAVGTNKSTLYIRRTDDNKFNGWVAAVEVQRYMAPVIKSFKIGAVSGTIDQEHKTIAIELPYGTTLSGVAATIEAYANGGATVTAPTPLAYDTPLGYKVSSAYAEDGDVDYTVTITEAEHYEAMIVGGANYTTLVAAVTAAHADDVVKLLDNVDLMATGLTIAENITLDLNGFNIKAGEQIDNDILVPAGKKLTLVDNSANAEGKIYTEQAYTGAVTGYGLIRVAGELLMQSGNIYAVIESDPANLGQFAVVLGAGGKATIEGGQIKAGWYAISNNGNNTGSTIIVSGGELISTADFAIYNPAKESTVTVTGGVVYGAAGGIAMNRGELIVTGGTITSKDQGSTGTWGDGTGGMSNAAISASGKYESVEVEISGGTIIAEGTAVMITNGTTNPVEVAISGGQFSHVVPAEYCADGFAPVTEPNAQGKYEVEDKRIYIFDGSTMSNMATSPSGAISWAKVGDVMSATDKSGTYDEVNYTKALQLGNSTTTKHFRIDVALNNAAKIEVIGMSNSSSDTRHAWLTNSTEKGDFADAIAGLATTGYNPAMFATDWLEEGSYYLHADNTVNIFLIRVTAKEVDPKCEQPTITTQPATDLTFGAGNMTATVVAEVSDEGTLTYQWYNAANDEAVVGQTTATLTTADEGTYYVIVTNTKASHRDNSIKSDEAQLAHRVMDDATLSVLKYGTTAIALEADKYEYRVDLAMGTTDVPALAATATMAPYPTVVITNATEFVNYEATSTVVVTSEDGTATKTYTVKFVVDHVYTALVNVTESTTWNWSGSEEAVINDVANKGLILANYIDGANFEMIEGKENERARRNQNGGVYQGTHLHFNTTVPGKVKFYFRAPSSGEECVITVINNGKEIRVDSTGNSFKWSREVVVYGDVVIEMENKKEGKTDTRVQQIVFTEDAPDYTRNVTNNIGTLCVEHNVLVGGAMGATFYQIASRNEQYDYKIDFEEVQPNEELKAGEPYIFQSTTGKIELFFGEETAATPKPIRGMIGNYGASTLDITEENKSTIYYFAQNKLWNCEDLVESGLILNDHRAYIDLSQVPTYEQYEASKQNNAPRRRVSLVMNGQQVATGIENGGLINGENGVQKVLINGKLFILRGEKMYDVTGKLVK